MYMRPYHVFLVLLLHKLWAGERALVMVVGNYPQMLLPSMHLFGGHTVMHVHGITTTAGHIVD